jgi:hypothetical protein
MRARIAHNEERDRKKKKTSRLPRRHTTQRTPTHTLKRKEKQLGMAMTIEGAISARCYKTDMLHKV